METEPMPPELTISTLLARYRASQCTPEQVIDDVMGAIRNDDAGPVWISVLDDAQLAPYLARLREAGPASLPLYGVPFAIKDNIDLAGVPTTAACPAAAFVPEHSAFVVQRLIKAGAVPVGKTNLDQFATGLVGTRSPYGACRNAFDERYISGGSSSGSAVAVARGLVSFALGTDTAGSGRVPAAFNNLVGLKPTRGRLSSRGMLPACRSLDTVSVLAGTAADAHAVFNVIDVYDGEDPWARPQCTPPAGVGAIPAQGFRFAVPRAAQLEFLGDTDYQRLYLQSAERLIALGGEAVEIDFSPFLEAAGLLYQGPWLAERWLAAQPLIEHNPEALLEITRRIISGGTVPSATDTFAAQYRLRELKHTCDAVWQQADTVLTPTASTIYRIEEVEQEPLTLNTNLGRYTNFMNLLDYAALAVPAGFREDGLPFGVTLFAPAGQDRELLALGDRLHRAASLPLGATGQPLPQQPAVVVDHSREIPVAVCGAHLSGLPLNHQLTERGARLLRTTRSAPEYRFYALPGGPPHRPGMVRVTSGGASVELEVWSVPAERFGSFVAGIPAPLGIGRVTLEDGTEVPGFVCEHHAIEGAEDITALGSWRRYLTARKEITGA